jgi:transcriptional regulator with XRE-family HTH domain
MADDLRKRFGHLVAAHRKRQGLTQQRLADAAILSKDMIARIEAGATGARFPSIERLSLALNVDPAELFTPDLPRGQFRRAKFTNLTARLAKLSDPELDWLDAILAAALRPKP